MKPSKMTKHHRKPRSCGGKNDKGNISKVQWKEHEAYHTLFGTMSPEEIAHELNSKWIPLDWQMIAVKKNKGGD